MNLFNIILFITYSILSAAFLTPSQKKLVQNIIQNKDVSPEIKNKTKEIIAIHYTPWALSQYNIFVYKNRNYLHKHHVHLSDLRQYAMLGMIKALKNYNASVDFTIYAQKYVLGTLHQGVTDLIPSRPIMHKSRLHGNKVPITTFTHENTWMFDKLDKRNGRECGPDKILHGKHEYIHYKHAIDKINNIVGGFTHYEQRMFYSRYSRSTLKEINTIDKVANLMCCSNETYRKKMNKIIEKIRQELYQ